VEHLVVAVLAATGIVVSVSSWPILAQTIEGSAPPAARRGIERVTRGRGWAVGPPTPRHDGPFGRRHPTPGRALADPDAVDLFEEMMRDAEEEGAADLIDRAEGRRALARGPLRLLDAAAPDAKLVVALPAGAAVVVVRDLGAWLMLAHRLDDEGHVQSGWARRSEVAILP
jgi:hypothetical protein